jgi:hypothetical protein
MEDIKRPIAEISAETPRHADEISVKHPPASFVWDQPEYSMSAAIKKLAGAVLATLVSLCALPALAEVMKPICSDRPGRGTGACTVEDGHWQLEFGLWDTSFQHRGGVTTDVTQAADPAVKYGLGDQLDLEASIALYQSVRLHDALGSRTASGVGDLFLHAKWNPKGGEDSEFTWILDPYLKLPIAGRDLGNGEVEAGLLIPISWEFGGGWSLDSTPEADYLLNESGSGYHGALIDVLGIGRDIEGGFNVGMEFWTLQNFDPNGTMSQYSLGPTLAWLADNDDQFDGGLAVGLNRATPDLELYVGFSRRF